MIMSIIELTTDSKIIRIHCVEFPKLVIEDWMAKKSKSKKSRSKTK